jgi:ankyrin repeat protein
LLTSAIAEIEQLCTIAGDGVNPTTESSGKLGRKASIGKILRSKSSDSGIDRAVNELGKTILRDCFRPSGLKLMKKTMKKNNCIIGPGDGYSLLHAFAKRGRTSVVEYILAKGADPNARDNFNLTPLLRAVMEEHYEMANLLIKRGADYEATFEGNSCLIEATLQNNDALVRLLLDSGAFIEAKTKDGHTALHLAAANAYVNVVQILLQYGANVNTRDHKQMTPLMAAALRNKYWMVHLLLVMGADVGARDKDGETALELHQNKAASKILCLNQLYDMRNTPVARLLQSEMIRQRRISQGEGDLSITPGLEKLELEFE